MTTPIRPLTRAEIESAAFGPLLWEAAGVDADALMHIRDAELPHLDVIGTVEADAASAGDVVGFTAFDRRPDHLELHYLAVSEAARGVGLGARLIDAVRASAPGLALRAETDDDAVEFYRSLGFTVRDAPRDARWPGRRRYACEIGPREASA